MNEQIKKEKKIFFNKLKDKSPSERKHFHYQSVLNLSYAITFFSNEKANTLKELLLKYFDELNSLNYNLSKLESAKLYSIYILPIGKYLIDKSGFITKMNFKMKILFGAIIDFVLYQILDFYYYPIFSIIFTFWGYINQKEAIKKHRFFSVNW